MRAWFFALAVMPLSSFADPVKDAVAAVFPTAADSMEIHSTPLAGIKEVVIGTQVFYVSEDGGFLLAGPLISLAKNENLTETRLSEARHKILSSAQLSTPIAYSSSVARHQVAVVTNVDCGYCRAMHARLKEYTDLGIEFNYIMTASGQPDSPAYEKTAALLCAEDPAAAVTTAMNQGSVEIIPECAHGLDEHLKLARDLGANTTPNLILPDGQLIRGYVTPDQLLGLLDGIAQSDQ